MSRRRPFSKEKGWGMAPEAECLSRKCQALNSNPSIILYTYMYTSYYLEK
jgi:hypothetical protein